MKQRAALLVYLLCLAQGAAAHVLDFVRRGWPPYHHGPLLLRAFWTALVLLDPAVLFLLLKHRRAGLLAAAGVMLLDVGANSYAAFALRDAGFAVALPLQCGFLGYVLGSLPFLWPQARLK